jgi:hypothetical protein
MIESQCRSVVLQFRSCPNHDACHFLDPDWQPMTNTLRARRQATFLWRKHAVTAHDQCTKWATYGASCLLDCWSFSKQPRSKCQSVALPLPMIWRPSPFHDMGRPWSLPKENLLRDLCGRYCWSDLQEKAILSTGKRTIPRPIMKETSRLDSHG